MILEAYHGLLVATPMDVAHAYLTDLNAADVLQEQLDLGASGSSRQRYRADARILHHSSKPTSKPVSVLSIWTFETRRCLGTTHSGSTGPVA